MWLVTMPYLLLGGPLLAALRGRRLRLAPVQELLLEQDGLVVLRQPAEDGPVWTALAFPGDRWEGHRDGRTDGQTHLSHV